MANNPLVRIGEENKKLLDDVKREIAQERGIPEEEADDVISYDAAFEKVREEAGRVLFGRE